MRTLPHIPLKLRLMTYALEIPTKFIPWYKLPRTLALGGLWAFRNRLRWNNLYSTSALAPAESSPPREEGCPPGFGRSYTGEGCSPENPRMGTPGRRFGRNVPLHEAIPDEGEALMTPNPREISRKLLARDTFKPATTLNLLAAAWIQFQVHDWFEHDSDEKRELEVPIAEDDRWPHR